MGHISAPALSVASSSAVNRRGMLKRTRAVSNRADGLGEGVGHIDCRAVLLVGAYLGGFAQHHGHARSLREREQVKRAGAFTGLVATKGGVNG